MDGAYDRHPSVGMKQAREFQAALCAFVNLKAQAIWKG